LEPLRVSSCQTLGPNSFQNSEPNPACKLWFNQAPIVMDRAISQRPSTRCPTTVPPGATARRGGPRRASGPI
jgi:hypothetical protein